MSKMTNLNKTSIKPFVKWAGGKSGLLDELLKKLPTDLSGLKKYSEPMVGGGALFFLLSTKETIR